MMFGRKGQWAQIVNLVLVVMLPKNSGGRRPFRSFLTIFRIWMRARIIIASVGGREPHAHRVRRLWDGGTEGSLARSA